MRPFNPFLRPNALGTGLSYSALSGRIPSRCISSSSLRVASSRRHVLEDCHRHGFQQRQPQVGARPRTVVTLAIETSCDDTCVSILERHPSGSATLHFNEKITSDNRAHGGIHPAVAIAGHTHTLGPLLQRAITKHFPSSGSTANKPDFVTVTRGPGMTQNLAVGLNTAKGLAAAWDVPLLGVNHMQAHALTPRLVTALAAGKSNEPYQPSPTFPFLSLLVSGGHTMLVLSESLATHRILVPNLSGLAIGDMLDKTARILVPQSELDKLSNTMYAAALEPFAFPPPPATSSTSSSSSFSQNYTPPPTRRDEIAPLPVYSPTDGRTLITTLTPPLSTTRKLAYDFTGLGTQISRLLASSPALPLPSRRTLAEATMRLAFEHLASRVLLCLGGEAGHETTDKLAAVKTLVVSGGVARNAYLRRILRGMLDARGFGGIDIVAPPGDLCTDNAAMIAWTGVEMWEAGWRTELDVLALRKWPVDPDSEGGILGAQGWVRREGFKG
ncbi:glycoprotease family protein-like protein [Coniochaeta sp. 2T2.1]|nr:glycoprotease family protein-like protein [Coniochaeta sp. 2T2.1]